MQQFQAEPQVIREQELQRMDRVNRDFETYKRIEIALFAAGVVTAIAGFLRRRRGLTGIGIGLAAQSAPMLVLDVFAQARADIYTAQLLLALWARSARRVGGSNRAMRAGA